CLENLASAIDQKLVRAEIVCQVQIRPTVAVQISRSDRERPALLPKTHGRRIGALELPAAIEIHQRAAAIGRLVPAAAHAVRQAPVSRVLGLRQLENVEGSRWRV